jgi:hypothetical protein
MSFPQRTYSPSPTTFLISRLHPTPTSLPTSQISRSTRRCARSLRQASPPPACAPQSAPHTPDGVTSSPRNRRGALPATAWSAPLPLAWPAPLRRCSPLLYRWCVSVLSRRRTVVHSRRRQTVVLTCALKSFVWWSVWMDRRKPEQTQVKSWRRSSLNSAIDAIRRDSVGSMDARAAARPQHPSRSQSMVGSSDPSLMMAELPQSQLRPTPMSGISDPSWMCDHRFVFLELRFTDLFHALFGW